MKSLVFNIFNYIDLDQLQFLLCFNVNLRKNMKGNASKADNTDSQIIISCKKLYPTDSE